MVHNKEARKELYAKLLVQGKPVTFLLDTGASTSVLPEKFVNIPRQNLGPSQVLEMWNGAPVESRGTTKLPVTNPVGHAQHKVNFHAVAGNHKPLLGLTVVLRMNLVTVNLDNFKRVLAITSKPKRTTTTDFLRQYETVFSDSLGTLAGEAHLSVDTSIPRVISPALTIPVSVRPRVNSELDRLQKLGVIWYIDEPTD